MSYPDEVWKRVGRLLTRRRPQINPAYSNRQKFIADTLLNERLVSDLEKGRRTSYRDATLASVEIAYRLTPGSISKALADPSIEDLGTLATPDDPPMRLLGKALIRRRAELDPAFGPRADFAKAAGLQVTFIADVENGRLPALSGEEVAAIEAAYGWDAGSVVAVLAGAEPTPMSPLVVLVPDTTLPAESSLTASAEVISAPPADVPDRFRGAWAGLSEWQRTFMSATDLPVELRVRAIGYVINQMMATGAESGQDQDSNGAHAS